MSLFEFISDVGASIFGNDPGDDVKEYLEKEFPGKISNLEADHDDGKVSLSGECDCVATKEKAVLLAGNINGVSSVDDAGFTGGGHNRKRAGTH